MDESCRPGKCLAFELKIESLIFYIQLLLTLFKGIQGSTGNDKQKKEKKHNALEVMTCQIIHGGFQPRIESFLRRKKRIFISSLNYKLFFPASPLCMHLVC
jgi:hypothetical protein